jgi:hypothetical protein
MKFRSLTVAGVTALAVVAISAPSASAVPQVVVGTTATTLSLSVPTPAAFVGADALAPDGQEKASTVASVAALSTNPTWTLSAKDYGTDGSNGNGRMDALTASRVTALTGGIAGIDLSGITLGDPVACTNSAPELANPTEVIVQENVASGAIDSAGRKVLGGSDVAVAGNHAGNLLALPLTTFDTQFFQTVGPDEAVTSGCQYNIAVAYTLS